MIDIGANLTDNSFRSDLPQVLDRAKNSGVSHIVVTGVDVAGSHAAVKLCKQYETYLSCTVGVHPHHADEVSEGWLDEIKTLASEKCVVAIGETGLDYFRNFSPRRDQKRIFTDQIELAQELGLPLLIHDRDSEGELLEIISNYTELRGVAHCFTGSSELLAKYIDVGLHIGITGWICDERRGLALRESVTMIPDDRLLIETDAPYLLPRTIRPRPKSRRNEPAYLSYVVRQIAEARDQSVQAIEQITTANAKRLFGIR